ncbi:MAG: fimbrial chaperone protein [Paraglaciecola sp.]|jgi:fimbrial chaperone protein
MVSLKIKGNLITAVFGLGVFAILVTQAQAVVISPIHLEMSVKKPVTSFTVTNESDQIVTYQLNTLSWVQVDGKDNYIEANELVVTPPIVSIKPKSSQTFRVALFKASSHRVEQSYRIILDDISTYVSDESKTGLTFIFNHNLPLFYAPLASVDSVVWSICESDVVGKSCLLMQNKGNRHAKMVKFSAVSATKEEPNNQAKTVLAGSSGKWLFSTMQGTENTTSIKLITSTGPLILLLKNLPSSN